MRRRIWLSICAVPALDAFLRRGLPLAGGVAGVALLVIWLITLAAHRRGLVLAATLVSAALVSAGPITMTVVLCAILGRSIATHVRRLQRIGPLGAATMPPLAGLERGTVLYERMAEDDGVG